MKSTTLISVISLLCTFSGVLSTPSCRKSSSSSPVPTLTRVYFTNDTYTGYISENLNQQQDSSQQHNAVDSNTDVDKWRRNVVVRSSSSSTSRPVIYVRFVDRLKPSLRLTTSSECSCVSDDELGVSLSSADYDQEQAVEMFQLDRESISCMGVGGNECLCYFQIRLSDDPMVRDRLNREAKEAFKFQITTLNVTATINIQVILILSLMVTLNWSIRTNKLTTRIPFHVFFTGSRNSAE